MMTDDQVRQLGAPEGGLRPEVAGDGGAPRGRGGHGRGRDRRRPPRPHRGLAIAIIEAQQTEIAQMRAMLAG